MIADLRAELAADLGVIGTPVYTTWPDRITPPLIVLTQPASDYVTAGPTFGGFTVAVDLVILVARSANSVALDNLDALVEQVLANSVDWRLTGVDGPSIVTINGAEHLGTIAHLNKEARL